MVDSRGLVNTHWWIMEMLVKMTTSENDSVCGKALGFHFNYTAYVVPEEKNND